MIPIATSSFDLRPDQPEGNNSLLKCANAVLAGSNTSTAASSQHSIPIAMVCTTSTAAHTTTITQPTRCISKSEKAEFVQIIHKNPKVKALTLLLGPPTVSGRGKSVAHISPVFMNAHHIKHERDRILRGGTGEPGGDGFVEQFAEFQSTYPEFVCFSLFGEITAIIMQTRYMASNLTKDRISTNAVNGIVSDAVHGYWQNPKVVLIISLVYSFDLHCWVPSLVTYSNGASVYHYRLHFLALFLSIAEECSIREVQVQDSHFANVSLNRIYILLVLTTSPGARLQ